MGGFFCSRTCCNEYRKTWFIGENNHQYGLKGDKNSSFKGQQTRKKNNYVYDNWIYCPKHPFANKNGRVKSFRLLVEQNYQLFDKKYFVEINGKYYLPNNIVVHHKDLNHYNNKIENLEPLTKSEHSSVHNKLKTIVRDEHSRIVAAVYRAPSGIKIIRTDKNNVLPRKAHRFDAAFDVYAQSDTVVPVGRSVIPLGFKIQMPLNCAAHIKGRSGNDSKGMLGADDKRHDADVLTGLIDPPYTGEIGLIINNHEKDSFMIKKGDRIGQIVFFEIPEIEFVEVEEFEETDRNEGGFGSSGR